MMKPLVVACCLFGFGSSVYAQELAKPVEMIKAHLLPVKGLKGNDAYKSGNGAGDTIRYWDFSNSNDFTIYGEGLSPQSAQWQIGASSEQSKEYMGEINSATKANGYAWCSGIGLVLAYNSPAKTTYESVRTVLELKQELDLSNYTGALLSFNQHYRAFNYDRCFVEFSANSGQDWLYVSELNEDVVGNGYRSGMTEVLVPSEVLGSKNVKIRFRWSADNRAPQYQYGSGYGWQIDDLVLLDAPTKSLSITEVHLDKRTANQLFEYGEQPATQGKLLSPVVRVKNEGGSSQNVTVYLTVRKNGAFFATFNSGTPVALSSGQDTAISFGTFFSDQQGHYLFDFLVDGHTTEQDFNPEDNYKTDSLWVTDGIWSDKKCQNFTGRTMTFYEGGDEGAGYAKVSVAQAFQVMRAGDNAHSITTIFPSVDGIDFTTPQTIKVRLLKYTFPITYTYEPFIDTTDYTEVASSDDYVITANDITLDPINGELTYVLIPFTADVALAPGIYIATIETSGGLNAYNFAMGSSSNSDRSGSLMGNIGTTNPPNAFYEFVDVSPFIKLNLIGGALNVAQNGKSEISLGQNYPNPFKGTTSISYSLKEGAQVNFQLTDLSGKLVRSADLGLQGSGEHQFNFDAADLNPGIYFYTIDVNGIKNSRKMIISE